MNKIEKLIKELCSDGVELKKLREVAEVSAGNPTPQNSNFFKDGTYPFCRMADVGKVHLSNNFSNIKDKLNEDGIKELRLFKKRNPVIS